MYTLCNFAVDDFQFDVICCATPSFACESMNVSEREHEKMFRY